MRAVAGVRLLVQSVDEGAVHEVGASDHGVELDKEVECEAADEINELHDYDDHFSLMCGDESGATNETYVDNAQWEFHVWP